MSNYGYDERDSTQAVTRDTMHTPEYQQLPPPSPYGYGPPQGYPMRPPLFNWRARSETKPFFLTSEFGISLLSAIAIAISAATMHAFGGWRAWILITAIVVSYNVSRGIAKCGTSSRAHDPREDVDLDFGRGGDRDRDRTQDRR